MAASGLTGWFVLIRSRTPGEWDEHFVAAAGPHGLGGLADCYVILTTTDADPRDFVWKELRASLANIRPVFGLGVTRQSGLSPRIPGGSINFMTVGWAPWTPSGSDVTQTVGQASVLARTLADQRSSAAAGGRPLPFALPVVATGVAATAAAAGPPPAAPVMPDLGATLAPGSIGADMAVEALRRAIQDLQTEARTSRTEDEAQTGNET